MATVSTARLIRLAASIVAILVLFVLPCTSFAQVYAWGDNSGGQLGDGTTTDSTSPLKIDALSQVKSIAAGSNHTLALKADGTVWTWGSNSFGQLGDGTTTDSSTPVRVLEGVRAIAAGACHCLALKYDGTVWAWGYNADGELGLGGPTTSDPFGVPTPYQVSNLSHVSAIAAGDFHSLALTSDGTLWSWGSNVYGQLGNGKNFDRYSPVQVTAAGKPITSVRAIAAGAYHSLALRSDGTVWAWGYNVHGELGDGTTKNSNAARQVAISMMAIGAGSNHSLALRSDGALMAWGLNSSGQLGDGTRVGRNTPAMVPGLPEIKAFAGGELHSVALKSDGSVYAWGNNSRGQLGDGTNNSRLSPGLVQGLSGVGTICARRSHNFALVPTQSVSAWGANYVGQLGNGTFTVADPWGIAIPAPVNCPSGISAIAGGYEHNLALATDGRIWSWGGNSSGQLGNGGFTSSDPSGMATPGPVTDGTSDFTFVTAVSAGANHSLALKDWLVWAWGSNESGQLGDGTNSDSSVPVKVHGTNGETEISAVAIVAGNYHSMALLVDGSVIAWGMNDYGQLGDGTYVDKSSPVRVLDPSGAVPLSDIVAIAAGDRFSLALRSDGTVWAWGLNVYGQLGTGVFTSTDPFSIPLPCQVTGASGYLSGIVAIAAGAMHSLALGSDGNVWAWGGNWCGQLGIGSITNTDPQGIASAMHVNRMTDAIAISAGFQHSVAICVDGSTWSWGYNGMGQLGNGQFSTGGLPGAASPVRTKKLTSAMMIAAGGFHSLGGAQISANHDPIANAGSDRTVTVPHDGDPSTDTAAFTLDGSGSSDPDSDPLVYEWKEGAATVGNTAILNLSRKAGSYTFTLTVADPSGASASADVTITVNPEPNQPPVANAGPDQTVTPAHGSSTATFTLDGTASSDPDGDVEICQWKEGANVLGSTNKLDITASIGTHTYTLTVIDPYGAASSDDVVVTVNPAPNGAPVAKAGDDQTKAIPHDGDPATTPNVSFDLDGSSSSDPDNDPLTYTWKEGSTTLGSGAKLTVSLGVGRHTITLTVDDGYGGANSDDVVLTVNPEPNQAPLADAGGDQNLNIAHGGTTKDFTLDGSKSSDPDGDKIAYEWSLGGSVVGTDKTLSQTKGAGSYTYTLKVTDSYGASNSSTATVTVNPPSNGAPKANAGDDQTVASAHGASTAAFTLDGSASSDPDGDTLTYEWKEGATIVGRIAKLNLSASIGTHTYTLKVTDPYSASSSDEVVITVTAAANQAPVAKAGPDQTVTVPHDGNPTTDKASFTLDGSGSSDPDGDAITYEWKEGGSVVGTTAKLSLTRKAGTYTFTLKVTDPSGASSTDDVAVTVNAEPNQTPVANAGPDQYITSYYGLLVKLNGSGSSDPDGDPLTYVWTEGGAQIATGAKPSVHLEPGIHIVTLTVSDPYGASSTDTVQITVDPRKPTVITLSNVTAQRGKPKDIVTHLKSGVNQVLGKTLTLYVDGVEIAKKQSANPTIFTYTPPKDIALGTHTLKVRFDGDLDYQPSEKTATLTINR